LTAVFPCLKACFLARVDFTLSRKSKVIEGLAQLNLSELYGDILPEPARLPAKHLSARYNADIAILGGRVFIHQPA
jgi:hypothetical protein